MLSEVLKVCREIDSPRNVWSVSHHLDSEIYELHDELNKCIVGDIPGEDGIVGESVDVILCAIDLIYQTAPEMSEQEIMKVVERKLHKWVSIYGNGEPK